ncbi:MAG: NAD(P)-dependent oxidoreductase [Acidobacteriia bacterium]|jgi:nucleoside-diphosphate-sugar epimerase|nr:NAD(P)-dependent oxidoreductase [Terriglobia bacterium]
MRVFIAGATGVLGRALVRRFRAAGHEVFGLARSEKNEQLLRELGAEPRPGDLFDPEALARAASGCSVVIHAATAIPTAVKTRPADWALNDRIRREGTSALIAAAGQVGARIFLFQSIVWVARPADGLPFDEEAPQTREPLTESAVDGERIVQSAGAQTGIAVGVLRCGLFYSPEAASTRHFGRELLRRRLPVVGRGDARWSMIHVDDAAGAFLAVATAGLNGLWHVVDDEPVSVGELLTSFAARLGAPPPRRVPKWLARLVAGEAAVRFMTSSIVTSNRRLRQATGWTPRYPTYHEGLEQVVAAWRTEGFLPN